MACFVVAAILAGCTGSQGAVWQPPEPSRPTSLKLELLTGHSVHGRVITRDAGNEAPFFFTPDGLEIVAHVFHAGCRRAMAFDASGATGKMRRVGECGETWTSALDDSRGIVVEMSGDRVVKRFGATSGATLEETVQVGMNTRPDGPLRLDGPRLRWSGPVASHDLLDGVAHFAWSDAGSRAAVRLENGSLVTFELDHLAENSKRSIEVWRARVDWLSRAELGGRFASGPHEEEIVEWLEAQIEKIGLSPQRQTFEVPRFTGAKTTIRIDGVDVTTGFVALPTTDRRSAKGRVTDFRDRGSADISGPLALDRLPSTWTGIGPIANDDKRIVTFLVAKDFQRVSDLDFANAVWGGGDPVVIVSPQLARQLSTANSVEFSYSPMVERGQTNSVVARVDAAGRSHAVIVVSAHWDHIGTGGFASLDEIDEVDFPGANDNASGVASILALASTLHRQPLQHVSVEFVWTAAEEQGLYGARNWVKQHSGSAPELAVNFDMMGAAPRFFVSENVPDGWVDALGQAAEDHGQPLDEVGPITEAGESDHRVFHASLGSPVLFVHGMVDETWHKDEDRAGSLNPSAALRATHIVESVLRSIDAEFVSCSDAVPGQSSCETGRSERQLRD